jgi:hypothetical protein
MDSKSDIYRQAKRPAVSRKDSLWAICIIVCCACLLIAFSHAGKPQEDNSNIHHVSMFSPEWDSNMKYLSNAVLEASLDLPKGWLIYFSSKIPIIEDKDFPWLAQRLKQELLRAARNRSRYHIIIIGGINVQDIDEPILKASEKIRIRIRKNVSIVIVAPSTISAETKSILEKRGIRIQLIGSPSRNRLR